MGVPRSGRARRIETVREIDAEGDRAPDYASSFAVTFAVADGQSAEQWSRSILECPPSILRWFVLTGWRFVLRLRLAPRGAVGTVAGWTISRTTPDSTTLEVGSSLLRARKVLRIETDRLTLSTYVWFEGSRGRVIWSTLAPVHHRIEPLLLTLAASRRRGETAHPG